eukprot:CAMPEP_0184315878 /NCGR_PEP_ID=MMETSP1049-20130417/86394_1 /TAXON_ID=77928 /ORGANISM="Proteomonas sulcata, Strain CCMP704" /LENGTH=70 /DNA_ID=CAMNT_0026634603 /DNA_START=167 /DNA_END=376 /DNA_ORIENTATION=+
MAAERKLFSKYAAHALLLYLDLMENNPDWPATVHSAILPGIFSTIDICGQNELQQIHAMLSPGARVLFQN